MPWWSLPFRRIPPSWNCLSLHPAHTPCSPCSCTTGNLDQTDLACNGNCIHSIFLKNKLKLFYVCGVWPTCLSVHYAQAWVLGHALVEVWSTWPKLRQLRERKLSWRITLSDWLVGKSEGWWWWNFLIDGWWRMSHPVWMVPALGKCSWVVQESKIASHVEWASKQYSSRVPTLVPSPDFFLWWIVTYKLKQTFSSLKLVLFSVLS